MVGGNRITTAVCWQPPCSPKKCLPICKHTTKFVIYGSMSLPYKENVCAPDKACLAAAASCIAELQSLAPTAVNRRQAVQQAVLAQCLAAGFSLETSEEAKAMAIPMVGCLTSTRQVNTAQACKAAAIEKCLAKEIGAAQCSHAAQCADNGANIHLRKRSELLGKAMAKCIASGKSKETCKVDAIKKCLASGLTAAQCAHDAAAAEKVAEAERRLVAYSKLKLVFTTNHGANAVCVGLLKLMNKGKQVPYPAGSTSAHSRRWSNGYQSHTLIQNSGYYCSESDSFVASGDRATHQFAKAKAAEDEEVTITMPNPVQFDSFSLTQHGKMDFNPRTFKIMGMSSDGSWIALHTETNFNFKSVGATAIFMAGITSLSVSPSLS